MTKLRVVIVDDHAVLRAGLKMLLESQSDMEVVGEAGDAPSAILAVEQWQPDVMTVDLTMPSTNGFGLLHELKQRSPKTRLVVLTMHDDRAYFQAAVKAGADAYVLKNAADDELMMATRSAMAGEFHSTVNIGSETELESSTSDSDPTKKLIDQLSDREHEVLIRVAQGLTNQEIADKLTLSVKTVESYRARLMSKLRLKTRAELVSFALNAGLLRPEIDFLEQSQRFWQQN